MLRLRHIAVALSASGLVLLAILLFLHGPRRTNSSADSDSMDVIHFATSDARRHRGHRQTQDHALHLVFAQGYELRRRPRAALEARGYDVRIDRSDIAPGEDWRARLEGLILAADAVVFVILPDTVARWDLPPADESMCAWEIRRTVELKS